MDFGRVGRKRNGAVGEENGEEKKVMKSEWENCREWGEKKGRELERRVRKKRVEKVEIGGSELRSFGEVIWWEFEK